ncbi:GNAT family N-acetyltransferase [Xylophilus sp. GOD-11R]|uniref:GNAT family N-acetyltransferase n=1 Tax=Xylophilus sp. GOD-11R TaxID=3089814 RepID=UPI00298C0AEE|nr:GNAT family N-acetyltransferase [Xylophilus sp. GOD-11R]WPB59406.1 GNAT family N-acetyltransferase [Xylophilus sp. GOD-11R]
MRVHTDPASIAAEQWDELLSMQAHPSPFMRHAYLNAMDRSGSATARTGWSPAFITLHRGDSLDAACALYLKSHSYGEYVFDWAWASAYEQHGLQYYPKALVAAPFTPVPGARLLARDSAARVALAGALVAWCEAQELSSLHLLFAAAEDVDACREAGLMLRHTVQFHWHNRASSPYADFDEFLEGLTQEKRKKIRQERRKVSQAGVSFRSMHGSDITDADWDFFYRCYERTYLEHGNAPYLTRDFFRRMQHDMPENWLLFIAEREGRPIASSLIALDLEDGNPRVAYGRYWGALERVDCLHFEACYYQPLAWCIAHAVARFEGGAQGEHKMARALMPVSTTSAHWLARADFSEAVERFLEREGSGIADYMEHLDARSPFRHE